MTYKIHPTVLQQINNEQSLWPTHNIEYALTKRSMESLPGLSANDFKPVVNGPQVILTAKQLDQIATAKTAIKFDEGKADWNLMPFEAIEEINKVLEFGAKKYAAWNFAEGKGMSWTRLFNSMMRHMFAWVRGQDNDPESGLSHLAHAGCNIVFLLYYSKYKEKYVQDDRNKR